MLITPVLDHLLTLPDVDGGKIALLGVSQARYCGLRGERIFDWLDEHIPA